jgi:hypothetical protein
MPGDAFNNDRGHRLLRAYFDALASLDANKIAALFAEKGEIEDPVGTSVRRPSCDCGVLGRRVCAPLRSGLRSTS